MDQIQKRMARQIASLHKRIKAMEAANDDGKLESWADDLAEEERDIAEDSTGVDTDASAGDQNDKANDNWPVTASERKVLAKRLLKIARQIVEKE